jgi:ethanolamine ammonia-lyase small subunit
MVTERLWKRLLWRNWLNIFFNTALNVLMKAIVKSDSWEALRQFTSARIALGRSGTSIPIKEELAFKLAHAHARDAVHSAMDVEILRECLEIFQLPVLMLRSKAENRQIYLQRPDLGRQLHTDSQSELKEFVALHDVCIIMADGLSANAINKHVLALMKILVQGLRSSGLRIAPLCLVTQARVAIGDHIAPGLQSKISVMLIGERPGLSAADSIGAYITYDPKPGLTDEARNCISNIRIDGLPFNEASAKIIYLVLQAFQRKLSGIQLKDNEGM